jgi:hypothetical protein
MNMSAYQRFMKIFQFVRESHQELGANAVIPFLPGLRKKYALMGITDDAMIVAQERRKNSSQERDVSLFMQTAQVYELEDKHKYLLMATKNPKEKEFKLWKEVRLPFPEIFIDVEFDSDDVNGREGTVNGILLREMKEIVSEKNTEAKTINKSVVYGLTAYISGTSLDGAPFVDRFYFPIVKLNEWSSGDHGQSIDAMYDDSKLATFIKRFVINFILFLKEREVIYVTHERDASNREKRIKDGKMPLPNSNIIKITGQLKIYVDNLNLRELKDGKKLSGSWRVAGHDRHYRDERYVNMQGKVQWIEPYKKGEGVERKHVYRIVPDDEENTLNYDDIEPAKKPMREK